MPREQLAGYAQCPFCGQVNRNVVALDRHLQKCTKAPAIMRRGAKTA